MIVCEDGRCRIDGAVTVDTVGGLLRELEAQPAQSLHTLDFSAVDNADSAALALVFSVLRRTGGKLTCTGLPASFATLAELYGVTDLLPA